MESLTEQTKDSKSEVEKVVLESIPQDVLEALIEQVQLQAVEEVLAELVFGIGVFFLLMDS